MTTTSYDALSRVIQVQTPDTAAVNTGYSGNTVTVEDQAGSWRQSQTDAAGRLTQVIEDPSASITLPSVGTVSNAPVAPASSLTTTYTYDALDDLLSVNQSSSQMRTFSYDSLKRLLTATNPETGALNYGYDANGNLISRQDARFVTTLAYDKLNRLIQKSYTDSNTPTVSLCYDGLIRGTGFSGTTAVNITCSGALALSNVNAVRRLTWVSNGNSISTYDGFDATGRVVHHSQRTGTAPPYGFQYAYNLNGDLETENYPSGRQVRTCYDAAARPSQVQNVTGSGATNYASGVTYAPHGAISSLTLGNGLQESYGYSSDRLQLTSVSAKYNNSNFLSLTYSYCNGSTSCANNYGNLQWQSMQRLNGGLWTDSYTYDALNRLATAQEAGAGTWQQAYGYDAFGNRWVTTNTGLPGLTNETPTMASQYSMTGNNQIYQWGYDGSGNVVQVGGMARTFTYDAENRQLTANVSGVAGSSYTYDGEGRRVQKTTAWGATVFVYDAFGQLAAEYGTPDDVGTKYLTPDALGSTRLETAAVVTNGVTTPVLSQNYDYLPFGQELAYGTAGRDSTFSAAVYPGAANGPSIKFTSKERDAESGLDYFGARYFSGAQGRFTGPDWSATPQPIPYADLTDPQTLNLYGYVRNNPLSKVDPDGHCSAAMPWSCIAEGVAAGSAMGGPYGAVAGGFVGLVAFAAVVDNGGAHVQPTCNSCYTAYQGNNSSITTQKFMPRIPAPNNKGNRNSHRNKVSRVLPPTHKTRTINQTRTNMGRNSVAMIGGA